MTEQTAQDFNGLRVMVVDDDQPTRLLIRTYLENANFNDVVVHEGSVDALKDLRRRRFDLIVTDLSMQPVDGWALLQAIRRDESIANPYIPVILITQHADQEAVLRARDGGASAFVAKPVKFDNLQRTVSAVLSDRRPFVRTDAYSGPDRRRRDKLPAGGKFQRKSDYRW